MRRIDVIVITILVFLSGGLIYLIFQGIGFDSADAGIWSQAVLVGGLVIWLLTYLFRVGTHKMTYNQQLKNYEDAVLEKRLEEMTPEELAQLQAEVEEEKNK